MDLGEKRPPPTPSERSCCFTSLTTHEAVEDVQHPDVVRERRHDETEADHDGADGGDAPRAERLHQRPRYQTCSHGTQSVQVRYYIVLYKM